MTDLGAIEAPPPVRYPIIDGDEVELWLPDPGGALRSARLFQELERPRNGPEMVRNDDGEGWTLRWRPPPADRIEYQIEIETSDGDHQLICDPHNPLRAGGPFGERSVIERPGYRPPAWLKAPGPEGTIRDIAIESRIYRTSLHAQIWVPPGLEDAAAAPLLIVHDGPEFARYAQLTTYLEHLAGTGRVAPFRAALLSPHDRDETLSASATYARALTHEILPALSEHARLIHGRTARVGMGASLGGLSLLHVHRRSPSVFGGLFLQSGSFFRLRYDKQESGFPRFRRISRFVGVVLSTESWAHPIPIAMTCGSVEENYANNKAVRDALRRQGYDVMWGEVRDAHNWISWRDSFDPHLGELLAGLWGQG